MLKKSITLVTIIIVFTLILGTSCNKNNQQKKENTNVSLNSDLIKTDDKGNIRIDLKLKPKVGDIFKYKMTKNSIESNADANQKDKVISQEQTETYYYTQEVSSINENGAITLKMKYDSIIISVTQSMNKESKTYVYNSNVKDSISSMSIFLIYNNLIGNSFKIRISANNEFFESYELDVIYDKLFKDLGDTLQNKQKDLIKDNLKSSLTDVLM